MHASVAIAIDLPAARRASAVTAPPPRARIAP